ncbi:hypothetical protein Q8A73_019431 [Channa argus]|nr:hypothetical protein Q8A73_019431 [Channa argus]
MLCSTAATSRGTRTVCFERQLLQHLGFASCKAAGGDDRDAKAALLLSSFLVRTCSVRLFLRTEAFKSAAAGGSRETGETRTQTHTQSGGEAKLKRNISCALQTR